MDKQRILHYSQEESWMKDPLDAGSIKFLLIGGLLSYIEKSILFEEIASYTAAIAKYYQGELPTDVKKVVEAINVLSEKVTDNRLSESPFALGEKVTDLLLYLVQTPIPPLPSQNRPSIFQERI